MKKRPLRKTSINEFELHVFQKLDIRMFYVLIRILILFHDKGVRFRYVNIRNISYPICRIRKIDTFDCGQKHFDNVVGLSSPAFSIVYFLLLRKQHMKPLQIVISDNARYIQSDLIFVNYIHVYLLILFSKTILIWSLFVRFIRQ